MSEIAGQKAPEPEPEPHLTKMQQFWSWLAVQLGKRAGLVAVVGLLVTAILGFGTTKLTFATGQDSYLNTDDQVYIDNVQYQNLFGGEAMLTLFTATNPPKQVDGKNYSPVVQLMSAANQQQMQTFADTLSAQPDLIEGVITPTAALQWTNNLVLGCSPDKDGKCTVDQFADAAPTTSPAAKGLLAASSAASTKLEQIKKDTPNDQAAIDAQQKIVDARSKDLAATLARVQAIPAAERVLTNPAWVDFLMHDNTGAIRKALAPIFPDETHAQSITRLVGNASIDVGGAGSDLVQQTAAKMNIDGGQVTVTGAPVLLKQINDYLRGGMLTLGVIAIAIMALILVLLFNVRWRLLPLGVILIGVIWAFGLAGYVGIPLSLVTIAGLPVMLGVGIDYAIQMHARVEEEVVIGHNPHPIQETARNLCPALLVVTFDAIFAFVALRFAKVPMIRQFGLLLAVGIAVICFASIIVPLATLGIREYKSPTKGRDYREGPLGKLVVFLGALPLWTAPVLAVGSLAVFFGGLAVEDKLVLQTDPVEWVDQNSQAIHDFRTVQDQTGSSSELGVFIQSQQTPTTPGEYPQSTISFVDQFAAEQLKDHPKDLLDATALVTTADYLTDVKDGGPFMPTPEIVKGVYDEAPAAIKGSMVDPKTGAMNLIYRYGPGSLEDRALVVHDVESDAKAQEPPGITATPSGLAVVGVGLLENLTSNRIVLTYLALLFVGLFLAIRLRSIVRSLLSLVPVLIAVGAASLVAYVFNLKLSPMTAVGGPLVIAACTEFTSLILLRFLEERRRGLEPRAAVDVTAARTGRAFIVSGLTAIAGVAVIATSQLPLLRGFGIVVGMNVAVALLSALVVLPPLLAWADQYGWVSRGMIPDDVLVRTSPKYKGRRRQKVLDAEAGGPVGQPVAGA